MPCSAHTYAHTYSYEAQPRGVNIRTLWGMFRGFYVSLFSLFFFSHGQAASRYSFSNRVSNAGSHFVQMEFHLGLIARRSRGLTRRETWILNSGISFPWGIVSVPLRQVQACPPYVAIDSPFGWIWITRLRIPAKLSVALAWRQNRKKKFAPNQAVVYRICDTRRESPRNQNPICSVFLSFFFFFFLLPRLFPFLSYFLLSLSHSCYS